MLSSTTGSAFWNHQRYQSFILCATINLLKMLIFLLRIYGTRYLFHLCSGSYVHCCPPFSSSIKLFVFIQEHAKLIFTRTNQFLWISRLIPAFSFAHYFACFIQRFTSTYFLSAFAVVWEDIPSWVGGPTLQDSQIYSRYFPNNFMRNVIYGQKQIYISSSASTRFFYYSIQIALCTGCIKKKATFNIHDRMSALFSDAKTLGP